MSWLWVLAWVVFCVMMMFRANMIYKYRFRKLKSCKTLQELIDFPQWTFWSWDMDLTKWRYKDFFPNEDKV